MRKNGETLIIDLDGTLVDCNTFTEFVRYLFMTVPKIRGRIAYVVALRKLRLISHHEAKRRIVTLASKALEKRDIDYFVNKMITRVRPSLFRSLEVSERVILATAAPEIYAIPLASALGIREITATSNDGPENRGTTKLRNVERLGVKFDEDTVVITDHHDDLPLLRRNERGRNILINPDSATQMHLKLAGINFITEK